MSRHSSLSIGVGCVALCERFFTEVRTPIAAATRNPVVEVFVLRESPWFRRGGRYKCSGNVSGAMRKKVNNKYCDC